MGLLHEGRDELGSPGVGVAEYFQFITSLWKLAFLSAKTYPRICNKDISV